MLAPRNEAAPFRPDRPGRKGAAVAAKPLRQLNHYGIAG